MAVVYSYDPADGLVVVTVSDHPPLRELTRSIDGLVNDPNLPKSACVMVIAHANRIPPPPWELPGMVGQAARVSRRFGGRFAVVTATVGMVTTAHLITVLAGSADRYAAFTNAEAARRWLLGGQE